MGQAAVWATQVLWPILPRAVRTVSLVLVSSSRPYRPSLRQWVIVFQFSHENSVVGFTDPSFSGPEQGPGHSVPVGYLKGGPIAGQNLVFDVTDAPGTASEFIIYCSNKNSETPK